ncbi:GAF sensor signal transduction histidine kinase [Haloterrigena salina JCM 13891]|uniref:histidine kinase n=1 Tax=Haloterrigena salina JCM 13891 TaxID=1227488 RepID=M0BSS7_9EURY|nr:MEDS domain-containing protein [Haloterrigena salina]ELZ13167.1 GAF sensor signal transduction histidine kinase [Haloterrigena salina JCM 13891]
MYQRADRDDRQRLPALGIASDLESSRGNPAFHGLVGSPDESDHDHDESTDHVALLYEDHDEQFSAVIPFVRRGLERGERCLYIADENDRADVLSAMREYGIDVDDALESGALSVVTPADTYRRTGEFDRDAMVRFWEESLAEATEEDDFTGIRAAAEMTWALNDGDTDLDHLVEYEAILNSIYEGEPYAVCCQYNRERFPADVIHEVIRTHPLLVHDGVVSENIYYTPPAEFFGPDRPAREVERMTTTLRERTIGNAALERATERFRKIFEHSQDAIFINDPYADEILEANPAGCEMLGYSREELLELGPSDCHPHEMEAFREFVGTVFEEGAGWTDELSCLPKEGEPIPAELSASKITVDGRPCMLAIARDISERKARERAQRRLYEIAADPDRSFDEKLRAIFDLGCDRFDLELGGLARIDPETDRFVVEAVSGDHERLRPGAEVSLSETYCRVFADETDAAGEDAATDTASITDPEATGFEGTTAYEEFGVESYFGTRLSIADDLDRTFFFVSTAPREEPFTEAERTFLDLMGQWVRYELERKRYEVTLEETIERLEQSNERLEQFAYAASHDLQEPLRMVSSYLQLIESRYADRLDDDGEEFIDFAVDGAERMKAMIEALLAYSRIETRGEPFESVDLEAVVDDVLADLRLRIAESDAEIDVGDLPTVAGDRNQLHQLFQNLLTNALEYSGDEPPRVEIAARRDGRQWIVSVSDEGIGIEPGERERIFEVFERLHSRAEYDGTGIGLALCQRIVERHGGDIWVESEPGEGSTFSVAFPDPTVRE